MVVRKVVEIDEARCDGCGQCIPNCPEGALRIVEGKARLVSEAHCDGLGACLGRCPRDAIRVVEREADPFDEGAAQTRLERDSEKKTEVKTTLRSGNLKTGANSSMLRNWPVQIRLIPTRASFFEGSSLIVVADCVPFAYPDLHGGLLRGRTVLVGCPKFDDVEGYIDKLTEILRLNSIGQITVVNMEVPCCKGLGWLVERAVEASGRDLSVDRRIVTVGGELL
jgi:Pyruvate/2-oxoacid:ferredoxin oxidoreductase delta subunit